ncbi:hypothetical protein F4815DRAFT_450995 [Daldinia loculata]|nr:hypothetical protein F4815DRAFT_450995 [Daldinia loculata]
MPPSIFFFSYYQFLCEAQVLTSSIEEICLRRGEPFFKTRNPFPFFFFFASLRLTGVDSAALPIHIFEAISFEST